MSSLTDRARRLADPPRRSVVTACTQRFHSVTESGTSNSTVAEPSAASCRCGCQKAVSEKSDRSSTADSGRAPASPAVLSSSPPTDASPSVPSASSAGAGAMTAVGLGDYLPGSRSAHNAFVYHLLNYETNGGFGASGLNFFSQGLAPTVQASLQQALDQLASDEFAPAFANSTEVMDYAWGKLHRIVFNHPLNTDPFDIPNGGGFTDLAPDLQGLSRQGGFEAVDASTHSARANTLNGFMFGSGPSRRFVGEMTPDGVMGYQTIPGGQSGVFFHPNYSSQLPLWLTNSYHDLAVGEEDGAAAAVSVMTFGPATPAANSAEENDND